MAIRCSSCQHTILEEELPRLEQSASVLCPECGHPITLPEMTMPISIASAQEAVERRDAKKFALLVLDGKESGKVFDLKKKESTIGRSDCDVILDDAELSRRHAKIVLDNLDNGAAVLEDLGSTNGTFVGKRRVTKADLENRSRFRVGTHEIAFVVTDREP